MRENSESVIVLQNDSLFQVFDADIKNDLIQIFGAHIVNHLI